MVAGAYSNKLAVAIGNTVKSALRSRVAQDPVHSVGGGHDSAFHAHGNKLAVAIGNAVKSVACRQWIAPGPVVQAISPSNFGEAQEGEHCAKVERVHSFG